MTTIEVFPPVFLSAFVIVLAITFLIRLVRKKSTIRLFYIGMIEVYILLLISVTIFPIRIMNPALMEGSPRLIDYFQWIPFQTIRQNLENDGFLSIQLIGNIILLFPLPILFGYISRNKKFWGLAAKGILFSLGIEIIQVGIDFILHYPSRRFDVDDIILNAVGILAGAAIFKLLMRCKKVYAWIGERLVWLRSKN